MLAPETVQQLRAALAIQRRAGEAPCEELRAAIQAAAQEARERKLPPENLIIQLKEVSHGAGITSLIGAEPGIREWMVMTCLRAYWDEPSAAG